MNGGAVGERVLWGFGEVWGLLVGVGDMVAEGSFAGEGATRA
jgi:hypothetical protein